MSSGYLQPANRESQNVTGGQRTYEVPRYSGEPGPTPLHDANVPRKHHDSSNVSNTYENSLSFQDKSEVQNAMYTSTPVTSPSQGSLGFQTTPLSAHSLGYERKPYDPYNTGQNVQAEHMNDGLTGMGTPTSYRTSPAIITPGGQSANRLIYPTSPNHITHGGRVTPPIRSRIAELEAAMGIGPDQSRGSELHPIINHSTQSFEDSFTGLKEPQFVQDTSNTGQMKLLKDQSTESVGDSFTGLKESPQRILNCSSKASNT